MYFPKPRGSQGVLEENCVKQVEMQGSTTESSLQKCWVMSFGKVARNFKERINKPQRGYRFVPPKVARIDVGIFCTWTVFLRSTRDGSL